MPKVIEKCDEIMGEYKDGSILKIDEVLTNQIETFIWDYLKVDEGLI